MSRKSKSKRKSKRQSTNTPSSLRWEFDSEVPVYDFFEMKRLDDSYWLGEAVDSFVSMLKDGDFLTWEAVVCEEQGLPLTAKQTKLLEGLLDFSDDADDDPILYIDGMPRTSEPWHVILNKIAPHLVIEPFQTFGMHDEAQTEGWKEILAALNKYGDGLSLPPGVASLEETVPEELRHKLSLQLCFDPLDGLGQDALLTLDDPEEHYRVGHFIHALKTFKSSVAYFDLTLESLLARDKLPAKDREILIDLMLDELGMDSAEDPLAEHLDG